ncbi:MAG: hypothetical protein GXP48_10905 [Acidobacteria bacterium]|nr:hypothetical protein [Acidobacteriota bacterium]
MRTKISLVMSLLLAAAMTAAAAVPDMALDHGGTLYKLRNDGTQLILSVRTPGGDPQQLVPVPQTTGYPTSSLSVSLDRPHNTAVIAWQEDLGPGLSRVMMATYHQGTWFGPVSVSQTGAGAVSAINPVLLVHRYTLHDADGNPYTQTFIHLAWWADPDSPDGGYAIYASMRLDANGVPQLADLDPQELHSSVPYGLSCSLLDHAATFAHPKLVIDPQTGDPQLLFADLDQCLLTVIDLHPDSNDDDEPSATAQRKRNVIVFGVRKQIFVTPTLPFNHAELAIGHNLSVVMYWDADGAVDYVTMDDQKTSDVLSVPLGDGLNHEQAVQLIRRLAGTQ